MLSDIWLNKNVATFPTWTVVTFLCKGAFSSITVRIELKSFIPFADNVFITDKAFLLFDSGWCLFCWYYLFVAKDFEGISLLAKNEKVTKFYEKLNYNKIFDKVLLGERVIKMAKIL